jgi:hypothetical protein
VAKRPDNFIGLDLTSPPNRVPAGRTLMASNVRAYGQGQVELRNQLGDPIITIDSSVQSLQRMNDTTPAGPESGFVYISEDVGGGLYVDEETVAVGLSGNPVSIIPFRPNASVQPWAYIGDDSQDVTITTKFALDSSATSFRCFGQVKVRSDGLIYKTGIQEPPLAPTVSSENTSVTTAGVLEATAIPWTNFEGANPNFDYGESTGFPDPTPDGSAPFIVNVANASSITIASLTGTATINGGTKTPTSAGPSTAASTNPGHYIQIAGTGATPSSATVVTGAFTDGNGNVLAAGVAPLFVPSVVDVGAVIGTPNAIDVPFGAVEFQIGINSTGGTFSDNSGAFAVSVTVTTNALPSVMAVLGTLTAAVFGDSPLTGAVATYLWKNPGDVGGGIARSISDAVVTTTGNSFIFDASFGTSATPPQLPGIPGLPGIGGGSVPMQWFSISSESVVIGSSPVFPSPITATYPSSTTFTNFNFCLFGQIYIPEPGLYTFVLTNHDDCIWGIQNATFISGSTSGSGEGGNLTLSNSGQTITVAKGYPLLPRERYTNGDAGAFAQTTVVLEFTESGIVGIEIDYDFWGTGNVTADVGRILLLEASPTPGAAPTIIPPLTQAVRTNVSYAGVYRSSLTGAQSNPSPPTTSSSTPTLASTVSLPYSPDPQVDKCDFYRQDEGLANFTYVATGPNTNPPTPITDALTDLEAATNQVLVFTNFEPVPSIDLPQSGHCTVSGGVVTTLDTPFNTRWLPGTIMLIGFPTQLPYVFISRPISTTQVVIPGVPDGTDLVWNIAEPALANQPLPYMFGPTDNINYIFAVGDPLRPGTVYWCGGSNLDAWPDTNQFDLTDPSEALVNGAMTGGYAAIFSIKRGWVMTPNFFNALATVTGTSGSTWTAQDAGISRGLYMPRCLIVQGGGKIFFRVDDGIHYSNRGIGSQSITDDDLYPLFPHEGSTPVPVIRNGITIFPPDDTKPQMQKFGMQGNYLYYDFVGIDGEPHTLVFDTEHMGWVWDMYDPAATIHAGNQGESQQGNLVGCSDGSIRLLVSTVSPEGASLTLATPAIGGAGWISAYQCTVEYKSMEAVTLSYVAVDVGNGSYGPNPSTLPATGGASTKYTFKVSPNKFKWLQLVFTSADPKMAIYLDGLIIDTKPWGSAKMFEPQAVFRPSGGHGGQT